MRTVAIALVLLTTACDALPRDIENTSARIAATRIVRVGLAGAGTPAGERFLTLLERDTNVRIERQAGPLEHLVEALDHGRIDVIVAPVRRDALLVQEVALTPPLEGAAADDAAIATRAAVRNGENRWQMTVERVARRSSGR